MRGGEGGSGVDGSHRCTHSWSVVLEPTRLGCDEDDGAEEDSEAPSFSIFIPSRSLDSYQFVTSCIVSRLRP